MVTHPNREDTRRLRFSFFLLRYQTAGRVCSPFSRYSRRDLNAGPLGGWYRQHRASASGIRVRSVAPGGTASLSDRGYMRAPPALSSVSSQNFCNCKNLLKTLEILILSGTQREGFPQAGRKNLSRRSKIWGVQRVQNLAPRLSRIKSHGVAPDLPPSSGSFDMVNGLETLSCETAGCGDNMRDPAVDCRAIPP